MYHDSGSFLLVSSDVDDMLIVLFCGNGLIGRKTDGVSQSKFLATSRHRDN